MLLALKRSLRLDSMDSKVIERNISNMLSQHRCRKTVT